MQRFSPNLPLVVAGIGVEFDLYACILHFGYDVTGMLDSGILFTASYKENIKITVEFICFRKDTGNFVFQINILCSGDSAEHSRGEYAHIGKNFRAA